MGGREAEVDLGSQKGEFEVKVFADYFSVFFPSPLVGG
jgi:hypothetical protein